jgi:hypothetical protein
MMDKTNPVPQPFEHLSYFGSDVYTLKLATGNLFHQGIDSIRQRNLPVEENELLSPQSAATAPDMVAHFPQQLFLPNLNEKRLGYRCQLLVQSFVVLPSLWLMSLRLHPTAQAFIQEAKLNVYPMGTSAHAEDE